MDIVARLQEFMRYTNLPSTQFADKAGIPRPTLSQIINGRNKKISNEVFAKLHDAFPMLNMLWLMFGDGDMVNDSNIQFSEAENSPSNGNQHSQEAEIAQVARQPMLDFDVSAADQSTQTHPKTVENSSLHQKSAANVAAQAEQPSESSSAALARSVVLASEAASDKSRRIQSIMVFYTDSSFETFYPSDSERNA